MSRFLALSPWRCYVEDNGTYLQPTLVSRGAAAAPATLKPTWTDSEHTSVSPLPHHLHRPVGPEPISHHHMTTTVSLTSRKQKMRLILESIIMLRLKQWTAESRASTSHLRNLKTNCVITQTWTEAGRPLLVTTRPYHCWTQIQKICNCGRKNIFSEKSDSKPTVTKFIISDEQHFSVEMSLSYKNHFTIKYFF